MGRKKSKYKKRSKRTRQTIKREPAGNLSRFMPIIIGLVGVIAVAAIIFLLQKSVSVDSKLSPANSQASISSVDDHYPDVPRISPEEVLSRIESKADVVILDVRAESSYDRGHLPGAIVIPVEEIGGRYAELPAGKEIIIYCA